MNILITGRWSKCLLGRALTSGTNVRAPVVLRFVVSPFFDYIHSSFVLCKRFWLRCCIVRVCITLELHCKPQILAGLCRSRFHVYITIVVWRVCRGSRVCVPCVQGDICFLQQIYHPRSPLGSNTL